MRKELKRARRNPFVNQVFGFCPLCEQELDSLVKSQSLRESGLWFHVT